jgi:hypothetical protein
LLFVVLWSLAQAVTVALMLLTRTRLLPALVLVVALVTGLLLLRMPLAKRQVQLVALVLDLALVATDEEVASETQ